MMTLCCGKTPGNRFSGLATRLDKTCGRPGDGPTTLNVCRYLETLSGRKNSQCINMDRAMYHAAAGVQVGDFVCNMKR